MGPKGGDMKPCGHRKPKGGPKKPCGRKVKTGAKKPIGVISI